MAKETNFQHPPRGHVALLAYDSANKRWQAVHVDGLGTLQVDKVDVTTRIHGWDGDSWQKLPMVWGYSDRYADQKSSTTMPAGNSNLIALIVPEGEVWRVTGASAYVVSATCTEIRLVFHYAATFLYVDNVLSPVSGQLYPFACDLTMRHNDYIYGRFYSMTLNDDAHLFLWGYKMKVAE